MPDEVFVVASINGSKARQPRGLVAINGTIVPGWINFTVTNNRYYQADSFRVKFAISELPPEFDWNWFSEQTEIFLEVFAGLPLDATSFDKSDLDSLIYGRVDDIEVDPGEMTLSLPGRDLTAAFIDSKTSIQYQNLVASDIATQLAESHGLTAMVTPTTTLVGTYYEIDHASLTEERSEWDLLTWLARKEGFDCFVKGKSLYFQVPSTSSDPYLIEWRKPSDDAFSWSNVSHLNLSRSMTVVKGVTVTVRSWNQKQKQEFTAYYPSKPKVITPGKSGPFGDSQNYSFVIPGLTKDQAFQRAQQLHREITLHGMKMSADMPADNVLTPQLMIRLMGTETAWDQDYFTDSVTREMSIDEGYRMRFEAKNQNPESEPSI